MNLRHARIHLALLLSAVAHAQQSANLLMNGSFEQGADPGQFANAAAGASTIAGWTITGEGVDYVGRLWPAAHGARSIDLDGSARSRITPPYSQGGVAQAFATKPGIKYQVTFDLAANPFGGPPVRPLRVLAAGQSADFQVPNTGTVTWTRTTWTFVANADSTTLEIRSLTTSPNTGWGAVIDNVSVTAVASPTEPGPLSSADVVPAPASAPKATPNAPVAASAQPFSLNTMYQCPNGMSFQVFSCAGAADSSQCDVQSYLLGRPLQRGQSTRQQVLTLLPSCHVQTADDVRDNARAAQAALAAAQNQAGAGGFKPGDSVEVATLFGWAPAKVLRVNGNSYFVQVSTGAQVWKTYPTELRRIGAPNAEDRAHGVFALHDHVQINIDGRWESGEIITQLGQEYQVKLSGNRTAWANGANLRRIAATQRPAAPKPGTPPKPGLVSCAGKIEGRYSSGSGFSNASITFRSGKAIISDFAGGGEEFECWMSGSKIWLHKPGESADKDMPIDINNDGTLDTPAGELKKKGN